MSKVAIKNLTASPISLPAPYAGVLGGGAGTVIDIGATNVDTFAAANIDILGGPYVVDIFEVSSNSPVGPLTPAVSAAGIAEALAASTATVDFNGQKLSGVANPTAAQDAATKSYADGAVSGALNDSYFGASAPVGSGDPGGASLVIGGAGSDAGSGGTATLQGGGTSGVGAGGSAFVRGGQSGSGINGSVYVGDVFTESVTVGDTSKPVILDGLLCANNNIATPQSISTATPGTTDVVVADNMVCFVTVDPTEVATVTLDATTPIANGATDGQMLWLIHDTASPQSIDLPNASNVLAEYAAGILTLVPGAVVQFVWSSTLSKWVQTSTALTVTA